MNEQAQKIPQELSDALTKHQEGDFSAAIPLYKKMLVKDGKNIDALNLLGLAQHQQGKSNDGVKHLAKAAKLAPHSPDILLNYGTVLRAIGRMDEAEKQYRNALKLDPENWQIKLNLANLLYSKNAADESIDLYKEVVESNPEIHTPYRRMADLFFNNDQKAKALPLYEKFLEHESNVSEVWLALSMIYDEMGDFHRAEESARKSVSLPDANYESYFFHARLLRRVGHNNQAAVAYREALRLNPKQENVLLELCDTLTSQGEHEEAYKYVAQLSKKSLENLDTRAILRRLFDSNCDYDNMEKIGNILRDIADEDITASLAPNTSLSGLVMAEDQQTNQTLFKAHVEWGKDIEKTARENPSIVPLVKKPSQKIRIGFLSSDLKQHSVSKFLVPLMKTYDRDQFEIYCYATIRIEGDKIQEILSQSVDEFCVVEDLSDLEIANQIREDKVQILFELNGFTFGSRMAVLAWRAAPVQIEWLGYPYTTGLKNCDYWLVDEYYNPENEECMTEKSLLMDGSFVCFGEFEPVPLPEKLPAEQNGFVTFGSLNNPYKYSARTIELWAQVMQQVPHSKIRLVRPEFKKPRIVNNIKNQFQKYGISQDRVELLPNQHMNHLEHYNEMDLSLDTVPLTGGTTTAEALWMGVPVVSLVGEQMHQRISYSFISNCGAGELCAFDEKEYVQKATDLASNINKLKEYRKNLREQMKNSPLCRHEDFVRNFQTTIRDLAEDHKLID